ncbi:hypothetical protein GCM10007362_01240 [Saccharibacillus endophyticus]|uniref:Uncharacterized protein n=1 Tax=Saccharibacillus endophyticus TaxID=2060666 RepID=A0ABQ1ZKH2_9BACL|nr:hypothetical protein GCM10007362_01240 [Saccharibacillus endophyticus]
MEHTEISEWEQLRNIQKEEKMRQLLEKLPDGFGFKAINTFGRWGRRLETGIFVFEGRFSLC